MISKETLVLSLSAAISGTVESAFKKVSFFARRLTKNLKRSIALQTRVRGIAPKSEIRISKFETNPNFLLLK